MGLLHLLGLKKEPTLPVKSAVCINTIIDVLVENGLATEDELRERCHAHMDLYKENVARWWRMMPPRRPGVGWDFKSNPPLTPQQVKSL